MTKKIDSKKISTIKPTTRAHEVEETGVVGEISRVKATGAVSGVGGVGSASKRRATRVMSLAEREELFRMVNQEARKLFEASGVPEERQAAVENAVKMAIDSGLIEENTSEPKKR